MILARECRTSPHRPPGWSISGGSAVSDDKLRGQIHARLSEARLLEPTEVERQVSGHGVFLYAHEACYTLWKEESVVFCASKDRTNEP